MHPSILYSCVYFGAISTLYWSPLLSPSGNTDMFCEDGACFLQDLPDIGQFYRCCLWVFAIEGLKMDTVDVKQFSYDGSMLGSVLSQHCRGIAHCMIQSCNIICYVLFTAPYIGKHCKIAPVMFVCYHKKAIFSGSLIVDIAVKKCQIQLHVSIKGQCNNGKTDQKCWSLLLVLTAYHVTVYTNRYSM